MKYKTVRFVIVTAATLIAAVPVLAGDMGMNMGSGDSTQKDECLLVAQSCMTSVDSIQQRIDRLDREIGKGRSVYSDEELRKLEFQLKDAHRTLETLLSGGV